MPKQDDITNHGRAADTGSRYLAAFLGRYNQNRKNHKPKGTKMITQSELLAMLERRVPWHWRMTDWRKLPNGRIARFVDWKRKAVR